MAHYEKIIELLFSALDDVNRLLPPERRVEKSQELVLSDKAEACGLDSLAMVNLIVSLERKIEAEFGTFLSLNEELVVSREHNPFRTVRTLAESVNGLLGNE